MIKEENGLYIVEDFTESGFIVRSDKARYNFKSIWDKDFNLLNFYYAYGNSKKYEEYSDVLINKEHEDNRRCILAKSRHLKSLKLHLGLDEIKKEKPTKRIIWSSHYYNYDNGMGLRISNFEETEKQFNGQYKKVYMKYTNATPEKEVLVEEYTKRLKEFEVYRNEVFKKIFR